MSSASPESPGSPQTRDEAAGFIQRLQLASIRTPELSGRLLGDPASVSTARINLQAGMQVGMEHYANRFEFEVELTDASSEPVAELAVHIELAYDVDSDTEPSHEVAEYLMIEVGLFAAFPYARESIADLARRLGLPTLTVGLLKRSSNGPQFDIQIASSI